MSEVTGSRTELTNAALNVAVIGAIVVRIVGIFGNGWMRFVDWVAGLPNIIDQVENVPLIRASSPDQAQVTAHMS